MQPSWICFARVCFAGALIPFLPGCRVILVVWGFMFNRLDFSHSWGISVWKPSAWSSQFLLAWSCCTDVNVTLSSFSKALIKGDSFSDVSTEKNKQNPTLWNKNDIIQSPRCLEVLLVSRVNQATQPLFSTEFSYWAILILLLFISLINVN